MSQGKQLSHFQAMAMLRKALVASFIATPSNSTKGVTEMKSTENRLGSGDHFQIKLDYWLLFKIIDYQC